MKITITGSLGHISKPLAQELVEKGHDVTVISSKADKRAAIEALGATAAIGSLDDVAFLTDAFTGADAVYCMVPPANYFDPNLDLAAYCAQHGHNYVQAVRQSGVKRVVFLSSIGAHLEKGTGIIVNHRKAELILDELSDVGITYMRPTSFHYNLYAFIPTIKHTGRISANYGASDKIVWVAPKDIATAIAEEMVTPMEGRKVRYVASDELTCQEVASILGDAIGMPDLKWELISDGEFESRLVSIGINPERAAGLTEMQACMHTGKFFEDYYLHPPAALGTVKMTDFAKEFVVAFNQK